MLDDGSGAELCLGGVNESYPPQCSGPPLTNWVWADHEGDFEQAAGVRWGDFAVVGDYDGDQFTTTELTPAAEFDDDSSAQELEPDDDLSTPCDQTPIVEQTRTARSDLDAAVRASNRLDGYAGRWLDTSRDERTPEEMDQDAATGAGGGQLCFGSSVRLIELMQ